MPRGIPKNKKLAEEIEKEAGLEQVSNVAVIDEAEGVVQAPVKQEKKANEFDDDYTLQVIEEVDPATDFFRIPKKDPNYEYRFIRDEAKNVSLKTSNLLHAFGGWQLCPKKHVLKIGIEERQISPDGYYRVGDQILVFMPRELFEKKQETKHNKATARTAGIKQLLSHGNPSVGGKEIHSTMKGIQTGKALGFNTNEGD